MLLGNLIKNIVLSSVYGIQEDELNYVDITDVTDNSEAVTNGSVFVCIRGMRSDGHDYIGKAIERGARVIVCEHDFMMETRGITALNERIEVIVIKTRNTRKAFAEICAAFYGLDKKSPRLICVTGTNGKTTVSMLICRALNKCGFPTAVLGTLGGRFSGKEYESDMTTPDPKRLCELLSVFANDGAEYVVMEASSHALALDKLSGLNIEFGIFTNLTPEHLDFHINMENYSKAKAKLFEKCSRAVLWMDDPYSKKMISSLNKNARYVLCSERDPNADYYASKIELLGINGVEYYVERGNSSKNMTLSNKKISITCNIPGSFSVENSLLAFATLCELGIDADEARDAIAIQSGVRGRMERIELPSKADYSVIIDFAHTPDALAKLISSVRSFAQKEQRIVLLFGCGGDRDRSKRSLMGAIASRLADLVIITSDNCRSEVPEKIIQDIMSGFDTKCPHKVITDRQEAIEYAIANAGKGDIVLLCGKGHEEYELRGAEKLPFSEREIAINAVKRRHNAVDT